jgi:O-antigen ligase
VPAVQFQPPRALPWPSFTLVPRLAPGARARAAASLGCLICVLAAEGFALAHSFLWAAPLLCALLIVVAVDIPLVPFLAVTLLTRILTDNLASGSSRYSASVNLSGAIAVVLILIAAGLLARRRRGVTVAALATLWLAVTTAVAVKSHGASAETLREGVRETSILALAVIVCNSRGSLSVPVLTRLMQLVGLVPALLALYQLATHTGADVEGQIRSNGTFSHPNGAAMFFAIVAAVSLWRYVEAGRRRSDGLLALVYGLATISTFSLTGLAGLLAMLMALGTLRPGSLRLKLGAFAAAAAILGAFLATPLGAERVASESATNLNSAQTRGTANSSFAWRLYKWGTLIPEWERSPIIGGGLGTTVTAEGTSENVTAGKVPHNEYLRYLVETGVIGLAILVGALVVLMRALVRRRRLPGLPDAGLLGIALLAGCLLNAAADNTVLYSNTGYLMALVLGAVLSLPSGSAADGPLTVGARRQ